MVLVGILAAVLAAGALYQWTGSRRRPPPPGALVDVGGHRLHVHCAGRGSPVVLLESGIAASSLSWSLVQPRIAEFTRVCAYDRAGLAWSDPPSCPRTLARIVDDLWTLLAYVAAVQPLVLVGHSFGSLVVRAYAARHPERVLGLVLVDPPVEWLVMTPQRARMLWGGRRLSRIGAVLARFGVVRLCLALLTGGAPGAPRRFVRVFGPTAARTLERLVGEVRKLPPELHPLVQALWCEPKCFRAMEAYLSAFEREASAMAALVPSPEIPVTVISGGDQSAEVIAAQRAMASAAHRGRHLVAGRSHHWVQFDEPELIAKAVRDLVSDSGSGGVSDPETPPDPDLVTP